MIFITCIELHKNDINVGVFFVVVSFHVSELKLCFTMFKRTKKLELWPFPFTHCNMSYKGQSISMDS